MILRAAVNRFDLFECPDSDSRPKAQIRTRRCQRDVSRALGSEISDTVSRIHSISPKRTVDVLIMAVRTVSTRLPSRITQVRTCTAATPDLDVRVACYGTALLGQYHSQCRLCSVQATHKSMSASSWLYRATK